MPSREQQSSPSRRLRRAAWLSALLVGLALSIVAVSLQTPLVLDLIAWPVLSVCGGALAWLLALWLQRRLLWRVGRRLAFSYVLLGLLPFLLSLVLVVVTAYLLSGFFLGHLFRDAAISLHQEIDASSAFFIEPLSMESVFDPATLPMATGRGIALAYYRNGRRVAGDPRAPDAFPEWLVEDSALPPLVALADGAPTLASASLRGSSGVVAFFDPVVAGDLERRLSAQSGVWIRLGRSGDEEEEGADTAVLFFGATEFVLQPLARDRGSADREAFFEAQGATSPIHIVGVEIAGPLRAFADGSAESPPVSVSLAATHGIVYRNLFSASAQVDTLGWIAFILPAFLLFDVFVAATIMATFMILGLSRAVNLLSSATEAVQAGDFSARIPVRRKDQLGALQQSFNEMAEGLERLIAERTARKNLERELEFAREVQKNLIPGQEVQVDGVEFATWFRPSAAIGGDYFDFVTLPGESEGESDRLGVVIADVAGHGLSAGLRMAMIKAGLLTLVDAGRPARELLPALDSLVRKASDRVFVTASLSLIDVATGWVEMTNAGHPPSYLLRDGEVEEILIPGSPLGGLGRNHGFRRFRLRPGDVLVWLSDGFIEAGDSEGEQFGYERTASSLEGAGDTAMEVRDRILGALQSFTGSAGAEDDLTLVVMRYQPETASGATTVRRELAGAAAS